VIEVYHNELKQLWLNAEGSPDLLFCNNNTNTKRLYNYDDGRRYYKDGINDYIVHGADTLNPKKTGTKAAVNYDIKVLAEQALRCG